MHSPASPPSHQALGCIACQFDPYSPHPPLTRLWAASPVSLIPTRPPIPHQALGCIACQFDPYSRPDFSMIVSELAPVVQELEKVLWVCFALCMLSIHYHQSSDFVW